MDEGMDNRVIKWSVLIGLLYIVDKDLIGLLYNFPQSD